MQEIIQSPKVSAFASEKRSDTLVVGFSFHAKPRPGFGNLARMDLKHHFSFSVVDVACTMSFPYPIAEVREAVAAIARYASQFRRVITFGASVGGFVALNFASELGARTAIAASPPFSLNPEKVPAEKRWQEHRKSVTAFPFDNLEASVATLDDVYLLYDPLTPDKAHVERIEAVARRTIRLPLCHGGHPVSKMLHQADTLGRILSTIVDGKMDNADFRQIVRESRRRAPAYLNNLAAAVPLHRDALRVRLLEMAHQLGPSTDTVLAMMPPLVRLGRVGDVQALVRSMAEMESGKVEEFKALKDKNVLLTRRITELKDCLARAASG